MSTKTTGIKNDGIIESADLVLAERLGCEARVAELISAPAQDSRFMALVAKIPLGSPMGSSIPLSEAWSRGFHKKHLESVGLSTRK